MHLSCQESMPNTKHILFPFDFSGQSSLAVPYVRAMARRFNSKVTLISVVPPVWTPPTPGDGADIPFDHYTATPGRP